MIKDLIVIYINNVFFFLLLAFLYRRRLLMILSVILASNSMIASYISLSHFWRSGRFGDLLVTPLSLLEGSSSILAKYRRWILLGPLYLMLLLPFEYLIYSLP